MKTSSLCCHHSRFGTSSPTLVSRGISYRCVPPQAVYEVHVRQADARNAELLETHAGDVAARCRIRDGLRVVISSGGNANCNIFAIFWGTFY